MLSESRKKILDRRKGDFKLSFCYYCKKTIHYVSLNGIRRPFEDPYGWFVHNCKERKDGRITFMAHISKLHERIDTEHKLIVKVISKIHDLEKG